MGTLNLRRRRTALAAGLASLAMAVGLAAVPAQAVDKTKYIALGDSYAAGQGAGPYLDACYRSQNTYSELAADAKAIKLVTNAACSGRTTQEVVNTQLRQLNKTTGLVTITAGGNNLRVGDIFSVLRHSHGQSRRGSSVRRCQRLRGGQDFQPRTGP